MSLWHKAASVFQAKMAMYMIFVSVSGQTPACIFLQVIDIPNTMTVLPELLPYSIEMVSLSVLPCSVVFLVWGTMQLTWLLDVSVSPSTYL